MLWFYSAQLCAAAHRRQSAKLFRSSKPSLPLESGRVRFTRPLLALPRILGLLCPLFKPLQHAVECASKKFVSCECRSKSKHGEHIP